MALVSSKVAAGITILADHINKIIDDLKTNHTHATGEGGQVDHANLADSGPMIGVYHDHDDIETHMNGSTGSFDDTPGGDKGVHGLVSGGFVAGCLGSNQLYIQGDVDTLSSGSKAVVFPVAFSTLKSITLTLIGGPGGADHYPSDLYITSASASGFTANHSVSSFESNSFYWMAIGTKT